MWPKARSAEVRSLIRRMSVENALWGAPRIHGELLKLMIEVAQSTVAKYMAKRRRGSGQIWKTFLRNHVAGIALRMSESYRDLWQGPPAPSPQGLRPLLQQCPDASPSD
jgi:hypothetical protein